MFKIGDKVTFKGYINEDIPKKIVATVGVYTVTKVNEVEVYPYKLNDTYWVHRDEVEAYTEPISDFETVLKADVELTLKDHYGYGKHSIEQFWKLNGEAMLNKLYNSVSQELAELENNYTSIIGDIDV